MAEEPMNTTLTVDLGTRSYPIYIGTGLLGDAELYRRHIISNQVMIVTNETVGPLYLEQIQSALTDFQVATAVLPDGEKYKTLQIWQTIFDQMLEKRFNRRCTVIALGGGVVGDMAGFAAACYQRGVPFIQVPTTLLAQVDSSVGGKTGVNHPLGKNMIGAFYQPQCVVADTDTLSTLDDRQLAAGIAEIIKYGLIRDPNFFQWLEQAMAKLLNREPEALVTAIEHSCRSKAEVVAADELEAGQRALLNLGHTFGHAIETGVGYGCWLHGEAVGAGLCMAADLSWRQGWISRDDFARVWSIVEEAKLPVNAPEALSSERLLELMAVDKKVLDGKMRLVLLRAIGDAFVTDSFDSDLLRQTLDERGRATNVF